MNFTHGKSTRFASRCDRGSILVFVIGILVLLALSATAFLSTSRSDRIATKQYEANTSVDLLLESCFQVVIPALTNDPAISDRVDTFSGHTSTQSNNMLASRLPERFDPTAAYSESNPAIWSKITAPIFGDHFVSPFGQVIFHDSLKYQSVGPFAGAKWRLLHNLSPTVVTAAINGIQYPAFSYDADTPNGTSTPTGRAGFQDAVGTDVARLSSNHTNFNRLFAGDADGDGIADSLPVKIPVGEVNGLAYFAYFRIIDNGSAINVNTAMSRDWDFSAADSQTLPDGTPLINQGFFVSNIGLAELLKTYPVPASITEPPHIFSTPTLGAEFTSLISYRLNGNFTPASLSTVAGLWTSPQTTWPVDENGDRKDFAWISYGDLFDRQISQRLASPGKISAAQSGSPFPITAAISLAEQFMLRQSDSSLEADVDKIFSDSIGETSLIPSKRYGAQNAASWFDLNFNYSAELPTDATTRRPIRALLTGLSEYRNLVPTIYGQPSFSSYTWNSSASSFVSQSGNVPQFISAVNKEYPPIPVPPVKLGEDYWSGMAQFPVGGTAKVSILTAPFSELYRAFWQVMSTTSFTSNSDDKGTIFGDAGFESVYARDGPFLERRFDSNTNSPVPADQTKRWPRMFRSPIRSTAERIVVDPVSTNSHNHADVQVGADLSYKKAAAMNADQVVLLRAAIAAQNLDTMRYINHPDSADSSTGETPDVARYRDIVLKLRDPTISPDAIPVHVRAFGIQRQPYISEVYANTDTTPEKVNGQINPNGYIAIELYNPYDVAIDISECRFATIHRLAQTAKPANFPSMQLVDTTTLPATGKIDLSAAGPLVIPPKESIVLHNIGTGPNDAKYSPTSAGALATGSIFYVANLHTLFNREFILMRPLSAKITEGSPRAMRYITPTDVSNPTIEKHFMPLDSFDFSGLTIHDSAEDRALNTAGLLYAWHYQRETFNSVTKTDQWQFVYPGRYDGGKTEKAAGGTVYPRQMGTGFARSKETPDVPGWMPGTALGDANIEHWPQTATNSLVTVASTQEPSPNTSFGAPNSGVRQGATFPIQLVNVDWLGPRAKHNPTSGPNVYPYGQFARLGDMLQVPFIGTYIIYGQQTGTVYEVNPITMDAAMAEDGDVNDDPPNVYGSDDGSQSREQLGRFAPLRPTEGSSGLPSEVDSPITTGAYSDYADRANSHLWRYQFATRLFDFFTLNSPADDYLPNVKYHRTIGPENSYGYCDLSGAPVLLQPPNAVANSLSPGSDHTQGSGATNDDLMEQTHSVRGQININTASWKVLGMIPWIPGGTSSAIFDPAAASTGYLTIGSDGNDDNVNIAKAMVYWRDGDPANGIPPHGPFKSLFDIYRCPPIREYQKRVLAHDTTDELGDFSPSDTAISGSVRDGIRYDFEEQFLLLTRVSNLITTRSDTFTVYVLLQGWRNAGSADPTNPPEMVVERRAAKIYDRSTFTGRGSIADPVPILSKK